MVFAIPAAMAGCYYALALFAAWRFAPSRSRPGSAWPGVSILKPLHGCDDRLMQAIVSHAQLDYPEFELLLGVRENDTAPLAVIRRARERFPDCAIRIVPVTTDMPNGKVGSLFDMAAVARYPILVINDADICVEPDYLRAVAGPLANPHIGLVTALYRATAASFPARFEALGVATEFAPSVLVARLLGVAEFALGSTMAVRAQTTINSVHRLPGSGCTWPSPARWSKPRLGRAVGSISGSTRSAGRGPSGCHDLQVTTVISSHMPPSGLRWLPWQAIHKSLPRSCWCAWPQAPSRLE